jgi:hypothetical protein
MRGRGNGGLVSCGGIGAPIASQSRPYNPERKIGIESYLNNQQPALK